jgi:hypothetical protein
MSIADLPAVSGTMKKAQSMANAVVPAKLFKRTCSDRLATRAGVVAADSHESRLGPEIARLLVDIRHRERKTKVQDLVREQG